MSRAKTVAWITLPRGTAAGAAAETEDKWSWTNLTRPARGAFIYDVCTVGERLLENPNIHCGETT